MNLVIPQVSFSPEGYVTHASKIETHVWRKHSLEKSYYGNYGVDMRLRRNDYQKSRTAYQKSKSMVETSLLPCELLRNFMWRCVPAWMVRSSEELKTLRVKAGLLTALDEKELRELRNVSQPSPYTLSPDRSVIGITSEILCMTAILIEIFLVPVYVCLTQRWMGSERPR